MPSCRTVIVARGPLVRWAAAVICATLPPTAWAQGPAGSEFQVNSHTTDVQSQAALASDARGNFVVAWESELQDGSSLGVFGQRFNAAGARQGTEFQANVTIAGNQRDPAVASNANGDIVVAWSSQDQDAPGGFGVFARRFNASGLAQGGEFQVNSYAASDQQVPAVASDPGGNFLVVWASTGQDGGGTGIFGQRFNAAGAAQGGEFPINTYTTGNQYNPAVASDGNGDFVVVWRSLGQDGSVYGIFGQRYDASGTPLGGEFLVNTYTTNNQRDPRVAAASNGSFVVAWQSITQDGDGYGVFARRYDASGAPQGGEFQVNAHTTSYQGRVDVASDARGNFVVVWHSSYQDGSSLGVFGRRYDASGTPQGIEFQVNSYTSNHQRNPAVASASDENFVVAWHSSDQDASSYGVFGQRYGDLIFRDGFE